MRQSPIAISNPGDFALQEGESVDAEAVIANPQTSLYCLDHRNQRALFVETPAGVDLYQAPFLYQAQYQHAERLYGVPYEVLPALAEAQPLADEDLILVYSVGRAGSTLLSAALHQVEGVTSLSEPDVFTQLVWIRDWQGGNDREVQALLRGCTRLLCKAPPGSGAGRKWAIKFRGFCIEVADLLWAEFPAAKALFLYRDGLEWITSSARAFVGDQPVTPQHLAGIQAWLRPLASAVDQRAAERQETLSLTEIGVFLWLSIMERTLDLQRRGMPMLPVRFEDLVARPEAAIRGIFEHCGLPTNDLEKVFHVLDQDSQAGTELSRDSLRQRTVSIPEETRREIEALLAEQEDIRCTDFVIPGTWTPEEAACTSP